MLGYVFFNLYKIACAESRPALADKLSLFTLLKSPDTKKAESNIFIFEFDFIIGYVNLDTFESIPYKA